LDKDTIHNYETMHTFILHKNHFLHVCLCTILCVTHLLDSVLCSNKLCFDLI
jgi:hypothetical protein